MSAATMRRLDYRAWRGRPASALPLSRLDLWTGRLAQRHTRVRGCLQLRPQRQRPGSGPGLDLGELHLRQPERGAAYPAELSGRFWHNGLHLSPGFTSLRARSYTLACNWKVYVDNYLDGGYHVPHLHKALNSVLDYTEYTIENGTTTRFSRAYGGFSRRLSRTNTNGDRAYYYWLYPNLMINIYEGVMDTNLVLPLGPDKCLVLFDFFFADASPNGSSTTLRALLSVTACRQRMSASASRYSAACVPELMLPAGSRSPGDRRTPVSSPARPRSQTYVVS